MEVQTSRSQSGLIKWGIIILALATAFIHLYLAVEMMTSGQGGFMFVLNGLGYLALLGALFLPIPFLAGYRPLIRIVFIIYTVITILAWAAVGMRTPIGFIDKVVEVALVVLLLLYRPQAEPEPAPVAEIQPARAAAKIPVESDEIPIEPAEISVEPDDLKIVEGIGPAIAGLLDSHGIRTFRQLAETPVARLDEILSEANLRRLADPGTWPEQALLAVEGKWDALEELQEALKGGRRAA